MRTKSIGRLDINAPVILGLALLSILLLLFNGLSGGAVNGFLAVRFTSWLDPAQYLRLFTHVLVHADFAHFLSNYLLILVVGPVVESRYGPKNLLLVLGLTSLVTGLASVLFFPGVSLLGASGLAFMLIFLASFVNLHEGKFPLSALLVIALYIGNELYGMLTQRDDISRLTHIIGGLCGALFGLYCNRRSLGGVFKRE